MIDPKSIADFFAEKGVRLCAGVPDSVLSGFSDAMESVMPQGGHIIAANEGNAAALAIGHHLATGVPAVVYLQNSGLGNLVNPIVSLADPDVYEIPIMLVIGWRGMPGVADEPQHVKQGQITAEMLDTMGIPHWTLRADTNPERLLEEAWTSMEVRGAPAALLIEKGACGKFATVAGPKVEQENAWPTREQAIEALLNVGEVDDLVIATTGKAGRELFELREKRQEFQGDFLTVGGMGHASSIALGVALARPDKRVICLDGDGALLMHMGSMLVNGAVANSSFIHVLLNNGAHESVGGQPTFAVGIDFASIATAAGYARYFQASNLDQIAELWPDIVSTDGPVFLELLIAGGARKNLGRPTSAPKDNKRSFMRKLGAIHNP